MMMGGGMRIILLILIIKLKVDRANTFAATPGGSVNKTRTWIQTLLRLVRLQQLKLDNL